VRLSNLRRPEYEADRYRDDRSVAVHHSIHTLNLAQQFKTYSQLQLATDYC